MLIITKHELVKWLCMELDIGMVRGLNLVRIKLNFLFAKILFGMKVKGHRNPSGQGGAKN